MLTINELRDQFNLDGIIVVKSFDEYGENEQEHYKGSAENLSAGDPIADMEITYMYGSNEIVGGELMPVMVIEVKRD